MRNVHIDSGCLQPAGKDFPSAGDGDMLAEGVKRAAEKIGGEALSCAVYTLKGKTPLSHDHRALWTELFDTCFSNTGTIESTGGTIRAQQHGLKGISDQFDWEQVIFQNAKTNRRRVFEGCLGICRFPAEDIAMIIGCVNAATGWDLALDDAMIIGRRIVTAMRVFNHACGFTKELDAPSQRYGSSPADGPAKGKNIAHVLLLDRANEGFQILLYKERIKVILEL